MRLDQRRAQAWLANATTHPEIPTGSIPAKYGQDIGLTCDNLPGYVNSGKKADEQGTVPDDQTGPLEGAIYPYWVKTLAKRRAGGGAWAAARLWLYSAVAHGRPQEEDVEVPPRQAPRAALDRSAAREHLSELRVAHAAAPHVSDVQDVPRPRHRAAPHRSPVAR